MAVIMRKA